MSGFIKKRKKIIMFTFASTIITGVFSMAFSKNVIESKGVVNSSSSFYDLAINDINGEKINLAKFKGKKVMIVNVASRCGYTSQYEDLQALYEKNKDKLEIIAVPCNDYGSQESGSNSEIKNFCETRYGVSFTMGSKQKIKSSPISALYQWLSDPKQNGWNSSLPSWNFCKYVINEDGQLTHFLRSGVNPTGKEMIEIIDG
jgi:glutathione peroxidase